MASLPNPANALPKDALPANPLAQQHQQPQKNDSDDDDEQAPSKDERGSSDQPAKGAGGAQHKRAASWKEYYDDQYNVWVPWFEDQYLRWFTRDNKASYATRDALDKTKLHTPLDPVQDGANDVVAGQLGQDGLARPVGDVVSAHGINRNERGGRDDAGGWSVPGADTVQRGVAGVGGALGVGSGGAKK